MRAKVVPRCMPILRRCLAYELKYRRYVIGGLVAIVAGIAADMAAPLLIRATIDRVLVGHDLAALGPLAAGLLGAAALGCICAYCQAMMVERSAQSAIRDIRQDLHDSLQRLSIGYFDRTPTGQAIALATSDVDQLRRFLGFAVFELTRGVLSFLGVLVICIQLHPGLAALSLAPAPIMVWISARYAHRARPQFADIRAKVAEMTAQLQEGLAGTRVVRCYLQEEREVARFLHSAERLREGHVEAARLMSFYLPLLQLFSSLGTGVVLAYGGALALQGKLSVGSLVAFMAYQARLNWPVRMAGFAVSLAEQAIAAGQRVFGIVDQPSEVEDAPDSVELPAVRGEVEFDDVSFSYDGRLPAVERVSLRVPAGARVAVLGPTGSGKSTLMALLMRFYDPTHGRVLVDGRDVRTVRQGSLRSRMAVVLQDSLLFGDTIRGNIAFGRPDADDGQIAHAAELAQVSGFVGELEKGLDTELGERGAGLSGGQRQRVALARALVTDPAILILDDCTSSVDAATEQAIQAGLQEATAGRTTFIIGQRPSTIRQADLILVLDGGRLVEVGTHDELAARPGLYREVLNASSTSAGGRGAA